MGDQALDSVFSLVEDFDHLRFYVDNALARCVHFFIVPEVFRSDIKAACLKSMSDPKKNVSHMEHILFVTSSLKITNTDEIMFYIVQLIL